MPALYLNSRGVVYTGCFSVHIKEFLPFGASIGQNIGILYEPLSSMLDGFLRTKVSASETRHTHGGCSPIANQGSPPLKRRASGEPQRILNLPREFSCLGSDITKGLIKSSSTRHNRPTTILRAFHSLLQFLVLRSRPSS